MALLDEISASEFELTNKLARPIACITRNSRFRFNAQYPHCLVVLIIIALAVPMVARGGQHSPTNRIPEGWVHDYDYTFDLHQYLKGKADLGKELGKPVYVYLYADWCDDCRRFRKRARSGGFKELFDERLVLMLDFDFLNSFLKRKFRLEYVPVLVKVHANGSLGAHICPDFNAEGPRSHSLRPLRQFFDEHDAVE